MLDPYMAALDEADPREALRSLVDRELASGRNVERLVSELAGRRILLRRQGRLRQDAVVRNELARIVGHDIDPDSPAHAAQIVAVVERSVSDRTGQDTVLDSVQRLIASGIAKPMLTAETMYVHGAAVDSGQDDRTDALVDMLEILVGWVSPHRKV